MNDAQLMLSSNTPRFFKVVRQNTLLLKKMRIPRKFVRKHGCILTSPVTMQLPRGVVWKIELEKCGSEVWLKKGWMEFARHHSIESGHFLVFKHVGNAHFHVTIFDKTAVEIDYPMNPTHFEKGKLKVPKSEEMEFDDDCFETQNRNSVFPKTGDKSSFKYSRPPQKRMRGCEKSKAIERALTGFKSENPFFSVLMQPSYVSSRGLNMKIPQKFASRYMNEVEGEVTLGLSDGGSWPVQYITRNRLDSESKVTELKHHGWKAFIRDNNVEVDDVCIFELSGSRNKIPHFQVSIVRHADQNNAAGKLEEKSSSGGSGKCSEMPQISSASEYPSFKAVMTLSYLTTSLFIPAGFARSEFEKMRNQVVELRVGNKRCNVTLITKGEGGSYCFSKGWIGFAKENCLDVGDICHFQMINRKPHVFKVSITRTY